MHEFLTLHGIPLSLALGGVGLFSALVLIRSVLAADGGNDAMRAIAGAIQAGAKAYLHRQVMAVAAMRVANRSRR